MVTKSVSLAVTVLTLLVTRVRPSTYGYAPTSIFNPDLDPKHWGTEPEWEVCGSGKNQSPISNYPSQYLRQSKMNLF